MISTIALLTFATAIAGEPKCPAGAEWHGSAPPDGTERACKIEKEDGNLVNQGPSTEWYTTGVKLREGSFLNGERQGKWSWYWPSGKKRQEGWFTKGRPVGKWQYWDENGKKITKLSDDGEIIESEDTQNKPELEKFQKGLKDAFK